MKHILSILFMLTTLAAIGQQPQVYHEGQLYQEAENFDFGQLPADVFTTYRKLVYMPNGNILRPNGVPSSEENRFFVTDSKVQMMDAEGNDIRWFMFSKKIREENGFSIFEAMDQSTGLLTVIGVSKTHRRFRIYYSDRMVEWL